jgi:hypothetical protein
MSSSPCAHARAALAAVLLATGCAGPDPDPDVHVAGWESNGSVPVARLWTNGRAQDLSDGVHGALATGVAVSGGDVYVSGGVNAGTVDVATYWKNGTPVPLTDGSSQAFGEGITVSGADVYVAGYRTSLGTIATLWMNGVPTSLTDGTSVADAIAVAVSGGDVYVAGFEVEAKEIAPNAFLITNVAKLWRNGVATALSDGREPAIATAVAIAGSDVYVAGRVWNGRVMLATVWKNGVPLSLTDGTYDGSATGVAVDGGQVLVSGAEFDGIVDVAKVWRGDLPADLTCADQLGREQGAFATSLAAAGGDVYAAGYHGRAAVYWKNGAKVALTDGSLDAEARAIAVVVR